MSNIDTNVIIENLTELLQNSVNMTSIFYDIFLNPTPMDVELKQYDSNSQLITISIPNRAKDREIAIEGEGSPEGVVQANIGAAYVDTVNETVYFKVTGSGNTGWVIVMTQEGVNTYLRAYLTNNKFVTEDDIGRYLNTNNYVTSADVSAALATYKPTRIMSSMSTSGTIALEDNVGYAINATGNISFTLPTVTNLNILHEIKVQLYMSSARTISLGTSNYFNKTAPTFGSAGMYNIRYEYDNNRNVWVVGVETKGTSA